MNVMLLAMSTFPHDVVPLQAASQENGNVYSYFTQLEPGCKHLICKLADQRKKFDKVIVLCTPETLKEYKGKCIENSGGKTIDISTLTPYVFFEERMLSFIRNDLSAFRYEKELGIDIEPFAKFTFDGLYSEDELRSLFEIVPVINDDFKIAEGIKNVISKIPPLSGNDGSDIDLYLNAQGGSRTIIQIINTVLNMLKSRRYSLSEVNVIDFNGDKTSAGYPILNVTGSYLMNDLAAAMNAFLQYGRGDMFVDYYERYKKERGLSAAPEDSVVSSINGISDAILICNTEDFLKGIEQLKESVKEYDLLETEKKDPFFELIVNDIKNSYKELFDSSDIIDDLDVLVDWCLERGFIQQILTILEAKTPYFVFRRGFIYGKKCKKTEKALAELK
ncbi:MAG: TM1812 family CRISPR-associated protein, partial [Lachnospiraceae bacterium]|nr:TM1812 family CRISPR-associated protein [Lachnospiraceae bacterium]